MDPLSIISSATSIADISSRLIKFLIGPNKGSDSVDGELYSLATDIGAVNAVAISIWQLLDHPKNASKDASYPQSVSMADDPATARALHEHLDSALKDCKSTLQKLDIIIQQVQGDHADSTSTFDRVRRHLRKMSKDSDLLEQWQRLNRNHQILQALLTTININIASRTEAAANRSFGEQSRLIRELKTRLNIQIDNLAAGAKQPNQDQPATYSAFATTISGVFYVARSVRQLASANKYFMIPHNVSQHFMGRNKALAELKSAYETAFSSQRTRKCVVHGLDGSGKTSFCTKFARENQSSFWAVLYVDATSRVTAKESVTDIAKLFSISVEETAVKHWLQMQEAPWLLPADNADDYDNDTFLDSYVPDTSAGLVLVATREASLHALGNLEPPKFHLTGLQEDESAELLLASAGQKRPFLPVVLQVAKQICRFLGHLTLAVKQAGQAIVKNQCTLQDCLTSIKASLAKVRTTMQALGAPQQSRSN